MILFNSKKAKTIVSAIGGIVTAVLVVLDDDKVSAVELVTLVSLVLTSLGVYETRNVGYNDTWSP